MIVERKPRIGLLLIGSPRFKPLGEGTATEPMRRVSFERKRKSSANFRKLVKSSRRESFMSGRT